MKLKKQRYAGRIILMKTSMALFLLFSLSGCVYLNNGEWPDTQRPANKDYHFNVTISPDGSKSESESLYSSSPRSDPVQFGERGDMSGTATISIIPSKDELRWREQERERERKRLEK